MTPFVLELRGTQDQLAELIERVAEGQEILLTRNGRPFARLIPISSRRASRVAGLHAGEVWMSEDFNGPLPELFGD